MRARSARALSRVTAGRLAGCFVRSEPLCRIHECIFGVLALESEPVDPRLRPACSSSSIWPTGPQERCAVGVADPRAAAEALSEETICSFWGRNGNIIIPL